MNKENLERIFNDDFGTSLFPILANMYFNDGEYEEARKVCDVGMILNPNNNDGKFVLAKIALLEGYNAQAVNLLKEIIASDSMYPNALKTLLHYYHSSNKNQRAMLKVAHQLLELVPDDDLAMEIINTVKVKKPSNTLNINKKRKAKRKKINKKKTDKKEVVPENNNQNMKINPKMATLTFVDILIQQKQFEQAQIVLNLVKKNEKISKSSIATRQKRIEKAIK